MKNNFHHILTKTVTFLVFISLSEFNFGSTIIIDAKEKIKSISEGIFLAKSYDTLIIKRGIYKEGNIKIDKPLTIKGIDNPILDGDSQFEILTISSEEVHISGLTFHNAGVNYLKENAAVRFENVNSGSVAHSTFINNFFGIYLAKANNIKVINNFIRANGSKEASSGNGIHMWNCRDIEVSNNYIQGHRDGIYLEFVKQAKINNNHGENNLRYGLHFMFSDSCTYISNNFISNSAGVAVMYSHNVVMTQNRFADNWGAAAYGLLLKDITNSQITKNQFIRNTSGIYIEGCNRSRFENNLFQKNGWAIKLMANSFDNLFTSNSFIANSFDVATNSRQNFNTFSKNFWSMYEGYDLDKDGFGDVPYRPVKLFSLMIEQNKPTLVLLNSLFIKLLNIAESVFPVLTPETLLDAFPLMRET